LKELFSTSEHNPPRQPGDELDKVCHEPYDLITTPNVVEYRGWAGLSPPAKYHNLSGDLAVSTGKL